MSGWVTDRISRVNIISHIHQNLKHPCANHPVYTADQSANGSLVVKELINQTQAITKEQKAEPNQTRGSPDVEGKASREINKNGQKEINSGEDTKDGTEQANTSEFLRRNINDTRIGIAEVSKESGRIVSIGNKSGLFKGTGKGGILSYDSEGRTISQELLNKLKNTAIKDSTGHLIAVYHATSTTFDKFTIGDIGFHFGSKMQADNRAKDKNIKNPRYIGAYLNIEKPLIIEKDYMNWHANSVALNLWNDDIIDDLEKDEIVSLWSKGKKYNSPAAIKLREILTDKGYDGIAYANEYEGAGYSFIAFDDSQIVRFDKGKASRELDTEYLSAVNRGDMETAQKMVDEAAKNWGAISLKGNKPTTFYHGTNENFTEFRPEEMSSVEGSYFFAENREDASAYGDNIYEVYLSGKKLADYDNQPSEFYRLRNKRNQVAWLKERGYDGWYADMDSGGWGEISVFSPNQVKSTAPVTYDDDGNVIPLSERFNSESNDIRYSRELDVLDYITTDEELEAVDEMAFSSRTLLANALLDTITSSEEYKLVRNYQEEIAKLDTGDKRLAQLKKDLNQLYKQEKPNLDVINELSGKINKLER